MPVDETHLLIVKDEYRETIDGIFAPYDPRRFWGIEQDLKNKLAGAIAFFVAEAEKKVRDGR
jgi:hypothetical protein